MVILRDIELLLRQFFEQIVAYVRKHSEDVPKSHDKKWHVRRENGQRVLDYRDIVFPDYLLFMGNHSNEVEGLPSFPQLSAAVRSDLRISRAFLGTEGKGDVGWFLLFSYLLPIASKLLRALDEGKELEAEIGLLINVLDKFLSKDTFTVHLYAPLWNFKSGAERVELSVGVSIRPLPDQQLEKYLNSISSFMGSPHPHQLLGLEFQLEGKAEFPRVNPYLPYADVEFQANCRSLLKAFRLYRSGAIGIAFVGGDSVGRLGFGSSWSAVPRFEPLFGNTYEFSAADAPAIADLHSRLKQIKEDQRFELAMRRFVGSYEKPFEGDRLIDYWIALESLLMPEKDTSELSYRVSLRAASFVEEPGNRKSIFDTVRASYKSRSKFVHGDPTKVEAQIVLATEECLRKVLLRCLDLGSPPTREMLDSLVLGATEP